MNTNTFKVPYGLNPDNKLVDPLSARKGEQYRCPSCKETLTFKNGEKVAKHFSHKNTSTCSYETIEHILGKLFVQQAINEHISGEKRIQIKQQCVCCSQFKMNKLTQDFFLNCNLEERVNDNYVCDALAKTTSGALGIEIFKTHRMGISKESGLKIRWIEVEAFAIINNHYDWIPIKQNNFPFICYECLVKNEKACEHIESVLSSRNKVSLHQACTKCKLITFKNTPDNLILNFSRETHEAGHTCGFNVKTTEGDLHINTMQNRWSGEKSQLVYLRTADVNNIQEKECQALPKDNFNTLHICTQCLKRTKCTLCSRSFNKLENKYKQPASVCNDCFEQCKKNVAKCICLGIDLNSVSIINFHLKNYPYTLTNTVCESCHSQTPIFYCNELAYMWPKTISLDPPVTIKHITDTIGELSYWTNTCLECGSHIDDFKAFEDGIIANISTKYPFVKKECLPVIDKSLIDIEKKVRAILL